MPLSASEQQAFAELRQKIADLEKANLIMGYVIAGGNLSKLALGLCLSRVTVQSRINKMFGKNYKSVLLGYCHKEN